MPPFDFSLNIKTIIMKDYIIIKREICSKQNRKHIKKALISTTILLSSMYVATFAFVKIAFLIWQG